MSEGTGHDPALFERDRSMLWRRVGQRLLVMLPDGDVQELEGSGAVLWDLLAEPVRYVDLLGALGELYDEPADRIDADLAPALARFVELGIIRRVPVP